MKALIDRKDNNWILIRLSGRRAKIWGRALLKEVGPQFCKWDDVEIGWAVHLDYGPAVVKLLKQGKVELSYSEKLQPTWIDFLEQRSAVATSNPRHVLYVTDDAPDFIVKAVYHALLLQYHPDRGATELDKFNQIVEAYKEITGQD